MTQSAGGTRSWFERGTLRNPGPHLDRLPIGLDLSGVSLAEGVRATIASGVVLLVSLWLHSPALLIAAFAANLTCFCDAGGLLSTRVKALLFFAFAGALCWAGFGLLRNLPWPAVVPTAAATVFLCSMARVWGAAAQAVGNVLIVTVALALDEPLGWHGAGVLGISFVSGGLWAVVLTLVIWRIHPTRAATRAVEQVWSSLAALTADLRRMAGADVGAAAWDAHARSHRRATRLTIEDARPFVLDVVQMRGPVAPLVRRTVLRLDAAETTFAALIALSDTLEASPPALRARGSQALRLLRPLLALCGRGAFEVAGRLEPVLRRVDAIGTAAPTLAPFIEAITDALRIMLRTNAADDDLPEIAAPEDRAMPSVVAALAPLRDNLVWSSAILRHATRATVLTVPAIAVSLVWWTPYAHWLTITVALTMQPFFAATRQRVLERIGGTLLGGLIGAAVAFLPQTLLVKSVLLLPLCVVGFSVRQVSYGAYIACLTPLVVVLFDVAVPGHSDTTIAAMRFAYTVGGGLVALAGCMLLWPAWEPERLESEIVASLAAYNRLAEAIFVHVRGDGQGRAVEGARRAAGVANNNLEASLSRSLQEPLRSRNRELDAGLVIDAAVRRLGAALIALQHEAASGDRGLAAAEAERWQAWTSAALQDLAQRQAVSGPPPAAHPGTSLDRLRRAIGVIEAARVGRLAERDEARRVTGDGGALPSR